MSSIELREVSVETDYDPLGVSSIAPFTQSWFYGEWQKGLAREVRRFVAYRHDSAIAFIQLIKYPLIAGKYYYYAPYGPVTIEMSDELVTFLKIELTKLAQKNNAVFVRLDFTPPIARGASSEILSKYFRKAKSYTYHSSYFQPRIEWTLKLGGTETELLKDMHENTRYSIRAAERRGVMTEIVTIDFKKYFDVLYSLMTDTSRRNGFKLHDRLYYEGIFAQLVSDHAYLAIARHGSKALAINLIILYGGVANYVFSGTSTVDRNLMPAYACLWAAIREAKRIGAREFNFGAISSGESNEGWSGLTTFKKKFGGREVIHSEFYDIVIEPFWYFLYNFRKFIRQYI